MPEVTFDEEAEVARDRIDQAVGVALVAAKRAGAITQVQTVLDPDDMGGFNATMAVYKQMDSALAGNSPLMSTTYRLRAGVDDAVMAVVEDAEFKVSNEAQFQLLVKRLVGTLA
jgi:hypothetical protein